MAIIIRQMATRILITDTGCIVNKAFFSKQTELLRFWAQEYSMFELGFF